MSIPSADCAKLTVIWVARSRKGKVIFSDKVAIGTQKAKRKKGKNVALSQRGPQTSPLKPYNPMKKAATETRVCCTTNPTTCNNNPAIISHSAGHHCVLGTRMSSSRLTNSNTTTTNGTRKPCWSSAELL